MEKDAYTVLEFCQRHGLSRSGFYNALKSGQGPMLMRVGTRVMISREAAAAWRRAREATVIEAPKDIKAAQAVAAGPA